MYKPNNYENTQTSKPKVEAGGHTAIIKKVEETKSKTGKPMIVVYFDFDAQDGQPLFFTEEFRNDIRPDKKWPFLGTKYILCEDAEGNTNRDYKAFIEAWEESNGVEIDWAAPVNQMVNRRIGVVFGPVENEYQGKIFVRNELRYFTDIKKARNADVPNLKELKPQSFTAPVTNDDGFMDVQPGANAEMPF